MAESLAAEIIRDGRLDIRLNQRERFRWEFEVQNDNGTAVDLTSSTVEFFLKPVDLSLEPRVTLTNAIDASETGPVDVSTIPMTFPDKGFIKVDDEVIRFDERTSNQLDSLTRAADETSAAAHLAVATATLAGRIIDEDGPANEQLILDEANGLITVYISQPTLNNFRWLKAEYRLQMIDSFGDPEILCCGFATFEKRWAQ